MTFYLTFHFPSLSFTSHRCLPVRPFIDGNNDERIILSRKGLHLLAGHTDRIQSITWSRNGQLIASSGLDRIIRLWEVGQDHPRAVPKGHTAPINGLAFTPDSSSILSGSDDGSLRVWGVSHGQLVRLIQGYSSALYDFDWNPDGDQMITGGANAQVTVWEVAGKTPSNIWRNPYGAVHGVGWSPDGKQLATNGGGRVIQLWDSTPRRRMRFKSQKPFFWAGLEPGWETPGHWHLFTWHPRMGSEYGNSQMDGG